jgi:fermentation-respiration switch protein FrsA (DUF1100 family)
MLTMIVRSAKRAAHRRIGTLSARLLALLLAVVVVGAAGGALAAGAPPGTRAADATAAGASGETGPGTSGREPSFAVGLRVLQLIDRSRTIKLTDRRSEPRTLTSYVRYPALGAPGETDVPDAPPAIAAGPYPLVVFAHGFAVTPRAYSRLLQGWARAGYVVVSPVFPRSNANARGGPDEADVINQPTDVSFVISSVLSLSATQSPLTGLLDPAEIAVAGHSDGGETALAVAYSRRFHDARVGAAVILSGAEMSGVGGYSFTRAGPPLLAAQGTADTSNEPRYTNEYFKRAQPPKFLLWLLGAEHLPPYTRQQPQLTIVERTTSAFLDRYLKRERGAFRRLVSLSGVAGSSALLAAP